MEHSGPLVSIVMGSQSDWDCMRHAAETLEMLELEHEARVISAHRTPDRLDDYCRSARQRGVKVIIAGAGMAAALPGAIAAKTTLPVLGVPMPSEQGGLDSLLSMVQMPAGVPVGTLAVGRAGAVNAALLAAAILALGDSGLAERLERYREDQARKVPETPLTE